VERSQYDLVAQGKVVCFRRRQNHPAAPSVFYGVLTPVKITVLQRLYLSNSYACGSGKEVERVVAKVTFPYLIHPVLLKELSQFVLLCM